MTVCSWQKELYEFISVNKNNPFYELAIGVISILSISKVLTELCCSEIFSVTKWQLIDFKWSLSL